MSVLAQVQRGALLTRVGVIDFDRPTLAGPGELPAIRTQQQRVAHVRRTLEVRVRGNDASLVSTGQFIGIDGAVCILDQKLFPGPVQSSDVAHSRGLQGQKLAAAVRVPRHECHPLVGRRIPYSVRSHSGGKLGQQIRARND